MSPDLATWRDLVDILLIGFLLYRLVLVFQSAHALKILLTIATLYGLQFAANTMGLVLTSWFFQAIGPIVILIVVVVFRHELREMLLHANPVRSLFGHPNRGPELDLAGLADEVSGLARESIGALVVLRNRDALLGHIQEGIELDSRFDARLLRSIFLKDSPIHDGAAVIHDNRIVRVGAILPLSLRSDLPESYGTRHRAALGLSEHTDAIVVVASEERGEASVVHRGEVVQVHGARELEARLNELIRPSRSGKSGRSRSLDGFRHLVGYMLACAIVAACWWLYFGQRDAVTSVSAMLEFQNIPEGLAIERISEETVNLQISGRQLLLDSFDPGRVRVAIDLGGYGEGVDQDIRIGNEDVKLPPGLTVTEISPQRVLLDLVRRTRAQLRVIPNTTGEPPEGIQVTRIDIEPATLEVVGPEPILRARDALASTEVIDLSKLDPNQSVSTTTARVLLYPASIKSEGRDRPEVRVTIHHSPTSTESREP